MSNVDFDRYDRIHPRLDRVLLKRDEAETVTPGGIILAGELAKEKPLRGVILKIGPGKRLASPLIPKGYVLEDSDLALGQHVLFLKYAGDSFKFAGEELFFVKADDIIAIVDDQEWFEVTDVVVDDHRKVETADGDAWECLKCGFLVKPDYRGHRCTERGEHYTPKPEEVTV